VLSGQSHSIILPKYIYDSAHNSHTEAEKTQTSMFAGLQSFAERVVSEYKLIVTT